MNYNIIFTLLILLLFFSIFKYNYQENIYFNIPTRYCNPSKIMSYDLRGDVPIPVSQLQVVPFGSSEFIQTTPKECVDSSVVQRSILLNN
jgi:hypothetical protein